MDLLCLAPQGCTYPAVPGKRAIGVTGSWGASSLHSEAPHSPAHRTRCEQLPVAETLAEVSVMGAKLAPWLRCFGGLLHKLDEPPQPPAAILLWLTGRWERPVGASLLLGGRTQTQAC
jgi:hypothetical protein